MIATDYKPSSHIISHVKTQYNAYFVGYIVEGKLQVSSYKDETNNANNNNTDIFDRKIITIDDNPDIKIDVAFDKNTNKSYYKASVSVTHNNIDEITGKLENNQHIKDSDFNTLITCHLSQLIDNRASKDEREINDFKQIAKVMSCSCYTDLLSKANNVAKEIKDETLTNNDITIIEK
jgi:hypothetical protein